MIENHIRDGVLEIVISNPPVNTLGSAVRQGIAKAIADSQSDPRITALVIRGSGKLFSAGADITEFGQTPIEPMLPDLIDAIEASSKPVVAAIHGMALGGGLEVALGCHYRIATPSAKLGLPEVKLGILPGAGGTQRLPRLVGAAAALNMIVSGDPISGTRAAELGLIDKLTDESRLEADALAYAASLANVRRTGELSVSYDSALFDQFVADNTRKLLGLDAPNACIEAVRAATELPLSAGLEKERELFLKLVEGEQSKALRYAFFAERSAAKIDALPKDTPLRSIRKLGVVGAGTMGGGISMNFLSTGIPVSIVEVTQEALDRGTNLVRKNYEATAAKGRLTPEQVERALALLTPSLDFAALNDCDLIIEAVYEDLDIKKDLFRRLDSIAKPGALLASNTSYQNIDEIAAVTSRPQNVLGLHFFSPANVMKLVEVVRGKKTAPDALATGMDIARKIGKVPVVSGVCYGFIGNRMLLPRWTNAIALLLEGAPLDQIDRIHTAFGMPMGPFQMMDLAGVDIGWHRDPARIETIQDALCAAGRWGQKTNAGFYDYDDRRRPSTSSAVARIVEDLRTQQGISPRVISEDEIVVRTLYTMVNEGAKILDEGIAQRASDIDVVWVYGYGWPRHKAGPMFWADQVGLDSIVQGLKRYMHRLGSDFQLSVLLLERAAAGQPLSH